MKNHVNERELLEQAALLAADLYADQVLSNASSLTKPHPGVNKSREFKRVESSVQRELQENTRAKKAICAALGSAQTDIRDVTKVVGAAILPLALSGVLAIPITSIAFAVAGLLVFNAGITAFCSEYLPQRKD